MTGLDALYAEDAYLLHEARMIEERDRQARVWLAELSTGKP